MTPSLAALQTALASQTLEAWLAQLPSDEIRAHVRRALDLDHRLIRAQPASLANCLLARLVSEPELTWTCAAWQRELDERGVPWIRPVHGLPRRHGLLAELHIPPEFELIGFARPSFLSDELVVVPTGFDLTVWPRKRHRLERLVWAWASDDARIEPDPPAAPAPDEHYPRVVTEGWGPAFLLRSPNAERIALPCPAEGSARGHLSRDGSRLFVYGTHDEYDGGFAWILDPDTLTIERALETKRPVARVHECERPDRLFVETHGGLLVWDDEDERELPVGGGTVGVSPSGRYVATLDGLLRIWSTDGRDSAPPQSGFSPRFDPDGDRLVRGRVLMDGHTGTTIARLDPEFSSYLEGGPASPYVHFGTRWLVSIQDGLRAWSTRTGQPAEASDELRLFHWEVVAYDRAGERMAAVYRRDPGSRVELYELPSGRSLGTLAMAGTMVALSSDASMVAVRLGVAVEVWTTSGTLLRRFEHVAGGPTNERERQHEKPDSLRFANDDRSVASFVEHEGWRIWALEGESEQAFAERDAIERVPEFAGPHPSDWSVDASSSTTTFVHRPTNTTIVLPVAGPWVFNPSHPEMAACTNLYVELRAR